MTRGDSLLALVELMEQKTPEYLNLFSAQTDEEFEAAFDGILNNAVRHLEKNKVNFENLDEEGLSAVLAGNLSSIPGLSVTQEANSNGHVDISISAYLCSPARTKLGEAKIYRGPAYHVGGLEQLIGRYTTGREGRGLLINYVRNRDIKGLVVKLREHLDTDLPVDQVSASRDHLLKWSFITTHRHSSGEEMDVSHIGCNLYLDKPEEE